ncbi:MAG: urease accessory protein UreE [Hyphomicrobiales bacterium]|jgi:urease accessory protein
MSVLTCSTILDHTHHPADTITLDETDRHRRRMRMVSDGGIAFLLDLPDARLLKHGEGLKLSDGRVIEVRATAEALYEVTAKDARHLLTLAWQIGNRHLAADITETRIRIRADHVIKTMLEGLGATVREIEAPFDPEGGAYGGAHQGHHHHDHRDDHRDHHGEHHHD